MSLGNLLLERKKNNNNSNKKKTLIDFHNAQFDEQTYAAFSHT